MRRDDAGSMWYPDTVIGLSTGCGIMSRQRVTDHTYGRSMRHVVAPRSMWYPGTAVALSMRHCVAPLAPTHPGRCQGGWVKLSHPRPPGTPAAFGRKGAASKRPCASMGPQHTKKSKIGPRSYIHFFPKNHRDPHLQPPRTKRLLCKTPKNKRRLLCKTPKN